MVQKGKDLSDQTSVGPTLTKTFTNWSASFKIQRKPKKREKPQKVDPPEHSGSGFRNGRVSFFLIQVMPLKAKLPGEKKALSVIMKLFKGENLEVKIPPGPPPTKTEAFGSSQVPSWNQSRLRISSHCCTVMPAKPISTVPSRHIWSGQDSKAEWSWVWILSFTNKFATLKKMFESKT